MRSNILNRHGPFTAHIYKQRVENELGVLMLDEDWDSAPFSVQSLIFSRYAKMEFRIVHQLHLCKAILKRLFSNLKSYL